MESGLTILIQAPEMSFLVPPKLLKLGPEFAGITHRPLCLWCSGGFVTSRWIEFEKTGPFARKMSGRRLGRKSWINLAGPSVALLAC